MSKIQKMVEEFHIKYGHDVNVGFDYDTLEFRRQLILEEALELSDAIDSKNMEKIIDGIADLLYVVFGTSVVIGIDSDEIVSIVHNANMNKIYAGSLSKPIKPQGWKEPNFDDIISNIELANSEKGD